MIFSVVLLSSALETAWAQQQVPPPPPEPGPMTDAAPAPPLPYPAPPAQPYPAQPYPPPPLPPPGTEYLVGPAPAVLVPACPTNPCIWFGMEGLLWWIKSPPLSVPLLTTGPGSLGGSAGALGVAGTESLDSRLDYGVAAGLNLSAGGWFNAARTAGIEGSVFFLQQQNTHFGAFDPSGTGQFVINEPLLGAQFPTQVSAPGEATGSALVSSTSRLWGADINGVCNLVRSDSWTVNLLAGFRYLSLRETIDVSNASSLLNTATFTDTDGNVTTAPPGSSMSELDSFHTQNDFYGGQIGTGIEYRMGQWFVNGSEKVAFGVTREVVTIDGNTIVNPLNAAPVIYEGGNFTGGTNIGSFGQNRFAVVSDLKLNVGYQLGPLVRAWLGYDFMYWSSVLRPGNQIDNTFDGVTHPVVPMVGSSFWAQGIDLGIQFDF